MDSIFGIGLPELLVILLIAGIVMGPERIAHGARWLGRVTAQLQLMSRTFLRQVNAELDAADPDGQLKASADELNQLRRQVADLRAEILGVTGAAVREGKEAVKLPSDLSANSIMPPAPAEPKDAAATTDGAGQPVHRPPTWSSPDQPSAASANGSHASPGANEDAAPAPLPVRVETIDDPE